MKKYTSIFFILLLMCITAWSQQNKICEDQVLVSAQKKMPIRVNNIFAVKPEQIIKFNEQLANSRGVITCYVKLQNKIGIDIQVFANNVYAGFIEPYQTAFVNRFKDYQVIHRWSSMGEVKWTMKGSYNGSTSHYYFA